MSVVKSLWASIQGDPVFMRRLNGWLTIFWIVMIPVSIFTGWISSVTYVAALSLWALVSGHWSAWQAARVEVEQAREAEKKEQEDIPGEIIERLLSELRVEPRSDAGAGRLDAQPPRSQIRPSAIEGSRKGVGIGCIRCLS